MEVLKSHQKENNLFRRKEVKLELKAKSAPSRPQAKTLVSEKFSTPKENIRIKKIDGRFGSNEFILTANIYKSKADKDATEIISKKQKEKEDKDESVKEEKAE